jgi:hypothetical protein
MEIPSTVLTQLLGKWTTENAHSSATMLRVREAGYKDLEQLAYMNGKVQGRYDATQDLADVINRYDPAITNNTINNNK